MASDDLRGRLVAAFRAAAFDCPDDCGQECVEQHPIQIEAWHFDEIATIGGPVEALADVALSVVQAELERLTAELADATTTPCDAEGCAIPCTPYCPNTDDNRRRIWSDSRGQAWIEHCQGDDGKPLVSKVEAHAYGDAPLAEVEAKSGPLKFIGRTW